MQYPIWISNNMLIKVWDEITYPFLNFKSCPIEVWERIGNFMPHIVMGVTYYLSMLEL